MAITREDLQRALGERYEVRRELGRGGMAVVFEAWDAERGGPVALKVLHPELAATVGGDRFLREAQISARLGHPHIVPVHDSGTAGPFVYYTMQVVDGESLQDKLDREGQLPVDEALEITRQVASALDYAHAQGVMHRDIKPGNILLSEGGAVVTDFGIAKAVDDAGERLTETGLAMGTPAYMSPEQAEEGRRLDGRADQYSLACVLYEMLAGQPPFTGSTAQVILSRHAKDPVPSLGTARSRVTGPIESVIGKALEKAPADRFRSAGKFAEALDMAEQGVTPRGVTPITGTQPYPQGLWGELARRRVYQVAASYAVVAWALIEVAATVGPDLGVPGGFNRWLLWTAIAGFPVVLLLSWAFELTPKGLRRTQALGVTPSTGVHQLRPWHRLAMMGGVLAAGAVGLALSTRTAPATGDATNAATDERLDPRRIFVLPLENSSGDPSLDLVGENAQAAIIQAIDRLDSVTATRGVAGSDPPAGSGIGTILAGRVNLQGDDVQLAADLINAADGSIRKSVGPIVWPRADVRGAIDEWTQRMLSATALQLVYDLWEEPIVPPRFDALRDYLAGLALFKENFDAEGALRNYRRALQIDSGFVEAGFQGWGMLTQLTRQAEADSARRWVELRRHRMSETANAVIDFWFDGFGSSDGQAAYDLVRIASRRSGELADMWAQYALSMGRPAEAVRVIDEAGLLDDRNTVFWVWIIYGIALHLQGEHEHELALATEESARRADGPFATYFRMPVAVAQVARNEPDDAIRVVNETLVRPTAVFPPPCTLGYVGRELLSHGYEPKGREMLRRAARWFDDGAPADLDSGLWCEEMVPGKAEKARAFYEAGVLERARDLYMELVASDPVDIDLRHLYTIRLARTHARLGERSEARELRRRLVDEEARRAASKEPRPPYQHYYYGLAALSVLLDEHDDAVEMLREASRTGKAVHKGDWSLAYIVHTDPDFAPIRDDFEVQSILIRQ